MLPSSYCGYLVALGNLPLVRDRLYEHLQPASCLSTLGESYRCCCSSVSRVGEAVAVRLIPGMNEAWSHPRFFAYVDRWMSSSDDPQDLEKIRNATGMTVDPDFMQGQSWKI
jgi:hypothetical protein